MKRPKYLGAFGAAAVYRVRGPRDWRALGLEPVEGDPRWSPGVFALLGGGDLRRRTPGLAFRTTRPPNLAALAPELTARMVRVLSALAR